MSRPSKLRTLVAVAITIAAGLAGGRGTCAGNAYLARVGPPGLRFEETLEVAPPALRSFALEVAPAASSRATNSVSESASTAPVATFISSSNTNTNNAATGPAITAESALNPVKPSELAVSQPAASEMSVVTPQMLVEFIKPDAGAANSMTASPVKFGFTPPSSAAGDSSRAVYKSQ